MKIINLRIDGFGHFAKRDFGPFDKPVTIFYGPNEAGKTTLLEFIRSILFGFPQGRGNRNLYDPVTGGKRSGSLTFVTDAGETITVQRAEPPRAGTYALTGEAGNPVPPPQLSSKLGNHSRDVFENLFAFTLDELHDVKSLSDDNVDRQIYAAAMGAARLGDAPIKLNEQKRDRFMAGPRAINYALYAPASKARNIENRLRELESNAAAYAERSERLNAIERDRGALSKRRSQCESDLERLRKLERAWAPWNELTSAKQQLADLPENFPDNGIGRLETLESRKEDAEAEAKSAAERVDELESDAAIEPAFDERGLQQRRELIRQARATFDDYRARQTHLVELRSQLDNESTGDAPPRVGVANRLIAALLGILGISALAHSLATRRLLGVPAGLALVAVAVYLFIRGGSSVRYADSARIIREQADREDEKLASLESTLSEQASALGIETLDDESLSAAEESLDSEQRQLDRQLAERAAAERDLTGAREEQRERDQRVEDIRTEIGNLLTDADAKSVEDFRARAQAYDERQRLAREIENANTQLQRLSGDDALDELKSALAATNAQTIRGAIGRNERELEEIDEKNLSLVTESGAIQNSLDRLRSEEESSKLRFERQQLIEEMRSYAREWAVLTVAENLLEEAQSSFQRSFHPSVISHSQKFFHDVTGGSYQTISLEPGESEIQVADSNGAPKQPSELSRGTREQLFLALRFGFIRGLGERAERLPVIVDEVFVNFDEERSLRAARAFVELSHSNQILVFTCHDRFIEQFRSASSRSGEPEPQIVEI